MSEFQNKHEGGRGSERGRGRRGDRGNRGGREGGRRGEGGRGAGRGRGVGGRGRGQTIKLPSFEMDKREELKGILHANLSSLVIRRDENEEGGANEYKFTLTAHTQGDWSQFDDRPANNDYWSSLNDNLGNQDRSLESLKQMLIDLNFSESEINSMDMKNVEIFSGVVVKSATISNDLWTKFNTNLEGNNITLDNNIKMCGKLKFICKEKKNGTIFVLVKKDNRLYKMIDFIGGKLSLTEYLNFSAFKDDIHLFYSFIREGLEELNLEFTGESIPLPQRYPNGSLYTEKMKCRRLLKDTNDVEFEVSLTFLQVAPFFGKIILDAP